MFEVRGQRPVFSHGCPLVVENLYLRGPGVYHRFNSDDKTSFRPFAAARVPIIRNLRIFVHRSTDAMAHKLPND